MSKFDFKICNEEQLWNFVASHLKEKGIDTVLVGGAVVSIYTDGLYQSGDLDLIKTSMFVTGLEDVMKEIGFIKTSRHFEHPECKHIFIEFPGSFLEIGEDSNIIPDTRQVNGHTIKILSPTDCIKDRLASYIYFKAQECFDQAIEVPKKHPIKLGKVKKWCINENRADVFEEFKKQLI